MDYNNLVCRFEFNREPESEDYKQTIIDTFTNMYNYACRALNNCYEKWNREFDETYGPREDYTDDIEYNTFIHSKQTEVLEIINDALDATGKKPIWLESDLEENCNIYARTSDGYEVRMYLVEGE